MKAAKREKNSEKDDAPKSQASSAKKSKVAKEDATSTVQEGVYMFPNGDKYEGSFSRSAGGVLSRNGKGLHVTPDGTTYDGIWQDDKMTGQGRMEFSSGAVYEGSFLNNQFNGKGRYTWPNGSYYEGQFNENKMEGDGEFTDTDHQVWTGTFRYKAAPGLRFKLNL